MLAIPRRLIRQVRPIFRRCLDRREDGPRPIVVLAGDAEGLCIRLYGPGVQAEYHEAGTFSASLVAVPFEALAELEGSDPGLVKLRFIGKDRVHAAWTHGGESQAKDYPRPSPSSDNLMAIPPTSWTPQSMALLGALHDAMSCTSRDGVRFALNRVQLRGRQGRVVATDGRQLLLQSGFRFPWTEDVLVPRLGAFDPRHWPDAMPVSAGHTTDHVVLRLAAWTFFLKIDDQSRYPKTESVVPDPRRADTRWRIDAEDAAKLMAALRKLPGHRGEDRPLVIELGKPVIVRMLAEEDEPSLEVRADRSAVEGTPLRVSLYASYLLKALQLGFRECFVCKNDRPLLFQDEQRRYIVLPVSTPSGLGAKDEVAPVSAPEVAASSSSPAPAATVPLATEATEPAITTSSPPLASSVPVATALDELLALGPSLQEALGRSRRLLAGLHLHQRQRRHLATTLRLLPRW